jgi:hypothetical protein
MAKTRTAVDVFVVTANPLDPNDLTAKKQSSMCFTVLADSPDAAKREARKQFGEKYKNDLIIQSINHHSRTKLLLYCKKKIAARPGLQARDNTMTRTLPPRR